ncbi:hypothetical protein [Effusibacillus dendaii]|uniref:Major facilitator superfamily (MFS) profile domain-containing protein n=1 Tax=Effusibacillus dendaii TaxID=2743772 RepID=A0A7I8DE30_9BACL|nr:hypothetical protein [Effusibacillus dendaii]BCJ87086.1 hypothetical protein skT53_20710 [Effusibacillus dendaii]
METNAVVNTPVTKKGNAYLTLIGTWAGWLFDALDAGIFSFVIMAIAKTFKVGLNDVVSTVAWFLLATGIGGYLLGNISDRIGRKKNASLICIGLRIRYFGVWICT